MFRLLKGLGVTMKYFWKPKLTIQYPEEKPEIPDRFRGIQRFFPEKCIVCNMCVNACPTDVITLTGKPSPENPKKKVIDTYNIDFQGCILCDFCTEVCPTQAIVMTTKYDNLSEYTREEMFKDIDWLTNNEVYGNYVIKEEVIEAKKAAPEKKAAAEKPVAKEEKATETKEKAEVKAEEKTDAKTEAPKEEVAKEKVVKEEKTEVEQKAKSSGTIEEEKKRGEE